MSTTVQLPPNLYVVIRFGGAVAAILPSLAAASDYRDKHCKSGHVYACHVLEDGKHLILGVKLA